MPWKRDGNGPRGRGSRTDFANALRRCERGAFVLITQGILLFLFLFAAFISATSDHMLFATMAAVTAFIIVSVLIPLDDIREGIEWIWTGGLGRWLYGTYLRLVPGRSQNELEKLKRRGRGSADAKAVLALALVVILTTSVLVAGFGGVASADEAASVTHDGYLTDEQYIDEFNQSSEIQLTDRNVRTTIEETDVFVRLKAENPNSYPVDLTVKIHPDIIAPAEVGEISDTEGDVEATWRNLHDFESGQSYTEIRFRLEADSEVTFAPNRVRVLGVAWKDRATDTSRFTDRLPSLSDDNVDEHTYTMNSSSGSIVTVPLSNDDGQSIDDWHAVYRVGPDDHWKPITTDSTDPAFYRTIDNGNSVQFHFDRDNYEDGEIELEFTANPRFRDTVSYDIRSFRAGLADITGFNFLSASPGAAGVAP